MLLLLVSMVAADVFAQAGDTTSYRLPPRESGHTADSLDSLYQARRAMVNQWVARQRPTTLPTEEFASIYAAIGGLIRTSASDVNQYFSERSYRPNPADDRTEYRSVDRDFILGAQFRLSRSWGIFVQYEYAGTLYNTIVDTTKAATAAGVANLVESLDLTEHSLVTGGIVDLYRDRYYALRALGGIGAVYALVAEDEPASGASRSSSAVGFQLDFDVVNEFRIAPWGSAVIDLLTRTTSTGALKTSSGQTLEAPFGRAHHTATLAPRASKTAFGFAIGLRISV